MEKQKLPWMKMYLLLKTVIFQLVMLVFWGVTFSQEKEKRHMDCYHGRLTCGSRDLPFSRKDWTDNTFANLKSGRRIGKIHPLAN